MIEATERILAYTAGMSFEAFVADSKTYDAVLRNFTVLGEAARNIPLDIQSRHDQLPWAQLIGFRNVVIHEYPGLDDEIIWKIVQTDVSPLRENLRFVFTDLDSEQ